jgi:hypothetical protein
MGLIPFEIECDKCHKTTVQWVNPIPGYEGEYLRSWYCKNTYECGVAQVCKYKFIEGRPQLTIRLEPSEVYVEPKPQIGITIKPRARSKK